MPSLGFNYHKSNFFNTFVRLFKAKPPLCPFTGNIKHRLGGISQLLRITSFAVLLFFTTLSSFGVKQTINVFGIIKAGELITISELKVIEDNSLILKDSTTYKGEYFLNLGYDHNYILEFFKEGFMPKRVEINTFNIPKNTYRKGYAIYLDIELLEEMNGFDISIFETPVAKASYDDEQENFSWDMDYSHEFNKQYEAQKNAYLLQRIYKKEYQNHIGKGDELMKEEKYAEAIAIFEKAKSVGESEYPELRIKTCKAFLDLERIQAEKQKVAQELTEMKEEIALSRAIEEGNISTDKDIVKLYSQIVFGDEKVDFEVFNCAMQGFIKLKQENKLRKNILTIADFRMSCNKRRLWVIDLDLKRMIYNDYVAHGKKSGDEFATRFSNKGKSHMSSLGFYVTGVIYDGKHDLSLKLEGQEPDINSNAMQRGVVIHGADYVGEEFIRNNGRLGRSHGCPAVSEELNADLVKYIKEKSCFFIYYPSREYFSKSRYVESSDLVAE